MKKVSIIIPAYNKAELTVKTVESVLSQTYKNIEVIVVDDGSTDNTGELLMPYSNRVKYIHKKNSGACSARNLGISLASGEYIGFLDCDDLYLPQKIELCVDYLNKHPDFGFVHTAAYFIDEKGQVLRTFSPGISRKTGWISKNLLLRNFICPSTVMARRESIERVGVFDESIFTPADWDMWLRMSENFKAGYIDSPLTKYRMSDSYILNNLAQSEKEELEVLNKVFKRNTQLGKFFKNKLISKTYSRSGVNYLLIGNFDLAKDKFLLALEKNKRDLATLLLFGYFFVAKRDLRRRLSKKIFLNQYY